MKKYKISTYILALLLALSVWRLVSVSTDRDFINKSIDAGFRNSMVSLFEELYWTNDTVEDEAFIEELTVSRKVNAQVCKLLFPISSYKANKELENIMYEFTLMAEPDGDQRFLTDEELIYDIGYYMLQSFGSEELSGDIWERMEKDLQSTN